MIFSSWQNPQPYTVVLTSPRPLKGPSMTLGVVGFVELLFCSSGALSFQFFRLWGVGFWASGFGVSGVWVLRDWDPGSKGSGLFWASKIPPSLELGTQILCSRSRACSIPQVSWAQSRFKGFGLLGLGFRGFRSLGFKLRAVLRRTARTTSTHGRCYDSSTLNAQKPVAAFLRRLEIKPSC